MIYFCLCVEKRANHVCQKWDSFRALLLLEKKWILNGMMASSSVVQKCGSIALASELQSKRLKNRSLEANFGQKNLHFNCWLSLKAASTLFQMLTLAPKMIDGAELIHFCTHTMLLDEEKRWEFRDADSR